MFALRVRRTLKIPLRKNEHNWFKFKEIDVNKKQSINEINDDLKLVCIHCTALNLSHIISTNKVNRNSLIH